MIGVSCPGCRDITEVPITQADFQHWNQNKSRLPLIQNHFPNLSADEREAVQTGICRVCWEKMWPEEQEATG